MRKITKKAAAFLLTVCTGATLLLAGLPKLQAGAANAPIAPSGTFAAGASAESPLPFRELSGEELTQEMGAGINLGNTMDGHTGFTPGETIWKDVKTTKKFIQSLHDMGFNTIRVPVT
ncbi:MAG: glycoside hydrolase family 5 protein, partial [Lachnospiraceae bacterium]|nr:glycoside hydrolase family 5 protein [Lachnospiraceae bacterium]